MYNVLPVEHEKNQLYVYLDHNEIDNYLKNLNLKFDGICLDTFHEYHESINDLKILTSYLSEDGVILSHDCYPYRKRYATPKFQPGYWSGVTYICFIEVAMNNPDLFYAIIKNDNGIGIISKQEIPNLTKPNNYNIDKQTKLISLKESVDAYDYFQNNRDLIYIIS
jgi:hypothetical protein